MSILRIWSLLRGYVEISVEGRHIERFINMAVSQGYNLWDIFQPRDNLMMAKVNISVYPALRHIARTCRCRLKIRGKRGLPFLLVRMRNRKMLVLGACIFFISLYVLSSFIWFVEVTSSKELKLVTKEEISKAAAESGLKPGTLGFLVDNNQAAEAIEKKFASKIAFVGVEQKGTKVIIDVVEKVLPEVDPEKVYPGNVVSLKDGIVKEILVLSGEPKVAVGDTVKKGDILISGVIFPGEAAEETADKAESVKRERKQAEPILVSARGLVRARVWYEAQAVLPLLQHQEKLTGARQKEVVLRIGEKQILLKKPSDRRFKDFRSEKKEYRLKIFKTEYPVSLISTTYKELKRIDFYYSMAEAKAIGEKAAMDDISMRIPKNAEVVSRKVNISSANEKEIRVVVYVETVESIGRFARIH